MDAQAIDECSAIMAEELGWSEPERLQELKRVRLQLGHGPITAAGPAAPPSPPPAHAAAEAGPR
jgi:hypothetical protein